MWTEKVTKILTAHLVLHSVVAILINPVYCVFLVLKQRYSALIDENLYKSLYIYVNKCKYFNVNSIHSPDGICFFVLLSSPRGMEAWRNHQRAVAAVYSRRNQMVERYP